MGGKAGTSKQSGDLGAFVAAVPDPHRRNFDALRALIESVAPDADVALKWGTIQYAVNGSSLFAISSNAKVVNLYILALGVIAAHQRELAGIPQSKCVLRFAPDSTPPIATLRKVMVAARKVVQ